MLELLDNPLAEAGYELIDVEYRKEGKEWVLRVFIGHSDGIQIEDCVKVNGIIETVLDKTDPIPQQYVLEVSSPGIFRPLTKPEHFTRFTGEIIKARLFEPIEGRKNFKGRLQSTTTEGIHIEVSDEKKEIFIPYKAIAKANLEPEIKL